METKIRPVRHLGQTNTSPYTKEYCTWKMITHQPGQERHFNFKRIPQCSLALQSTNFLGRRGGRGSLDINWKLPGLNLKFGSNDFKIIVWLRSFYSLYGKNGFKIIVWLWWFYSLYGKSRIFHILSKKLCMFKLASVNKNTCNLTSKTNFLI